MYTLRLAWKNVASRRSSAIIILFIAFAIALLFVSNAIFDGTDNGIETTFVNSFTGSVVIRPRAEFPLSLFGDETPVTGELSAIPPLVPYADVYGLVSGTAGIQDAIPQLSGAAALNVNNTRILTALFGVYADQYLASMTGMELVEGHAYGPGEQGIMLNENTLRAISEQAHADLHVGDTVQLITTNGTSFTIRSATLTGVYRYAVQNATLDRIALIAPATLRDLMGIRDVSLNMEDIDESQMDMIASDDAIDDLFADAEDFAGEEADADAVTSTYFGGEREVSARTDEDSAAWQFIVCKTDRAVPAKTVIANLNFQFRRNGWPVQAVNWRTAAGGTVSLIYYLRAIFNIGIILILLTGFIVVNNTLVISALDRVAETGTLRALGAGRSFVALQFFFETAILTVTAGAAGCLAGLALNAALGAGGIRIENMYLAQLFGGGTLTTAVTAGNVAKCLLLSVALAFIGWLYPVHVAMGCNPVVAMRGPH